MSRTCLNDETLPAADPTRRARSHRPTRVAARAAAALCQWLLGGCLTASAHAYTDLVVATVNNSHMIEMQRLAKDFEQSNPDIRLKWVTLEEGVLRRRVTQDIVNRSGQFDVMTIGMYETPIWGRKGWLQEIRTDAAYDVDDLLPAIRQGLSVDGKLYAAPFYGESSMLMYRRDLAERAGVRLPPRPTWSQVRDLAARVHDPKNGVYGICLRGKPGWGDNMALLTTMVNTFGGQWFDMTWKPQLDSRPWREAVSFYLDLLQRYGPPGSAALGYNEVLTLTAAGKCGAWVDATIAAATLNDPRQSQVVGQMAFAQAPTAVTPKGANWLWAWALAIPAGSKKVDEAQRFVRWATSKVYIDLAARSSGWAAVPSGTRRSTYRLPDFRRAAAFAEVELEAIDAAHPGDSTLARSPYVGVQYVAIPEFQEIGIAVGRQISAALAGRTTLDAALEAAQAETLRIMHAAGYGR